MCEAMKLYASIRKCASSDIVMVEEYWSTPTDKNWTERTRPRRRGRRKKHRINCGKLSYPGFQFETGCEGKKMVMTVSNLSKTKENSNWNLIFLHTEDSEVSSDLFWVATHLWKPSWTADEGCLNGHLNEKKKKN